MSKAKLLFFSLTFLFISSITFAQAQLKVTKLDSSQLPKEIKYKGKLKGAIRWTDKQGDNIVIETATRIYSSLENIDADPEIFAEHYIVKDTLRRTWKVYDFIKDCPVDLGAEFIKNTLKITDLNKDGIAEIWIMYITTCRGDVSPDDMKIIMYEGQKKFAMRGKNKWFHEDGGEYKFDQAFMKGPKSFRDFALKLWNKNITQTFEE